MPINLHDGSIQLGQKPEASKWADPVNQTESYSCLQWFAYSFAQPIFVGATISDQEFETFWPLAKFYHNHYTLDPNFVQLSVHISWTWIYFLLFYCTVVEPDGGLPVIKGVCFRRLKWLSHWSHSQLSGFVEFKLSLLKSNISHPGLVYSSPI